MDLTRRVELIAKNRLFATLGDHVHATLGRHATVSRCAAGQIIVRRGERRDSLQLIVSGAVRLSVCNEGGREIILALLGRGDVACRSSLVDGLGECMDVVAHEATVLLNVPTSQLDAAARAETSRWANRLLGEALRGLVEVIEDIALYPLDVRLARLLLRLHLRSVDCAPMRPHRLSQGVLATMLCASRPKVNEHLQRLKQAGAVDLVCGAVSIRDEDVLSAWASALR